MRTATIFDIARASFVDGPGIRTTVFFKGCNLHCAWCHNPESQAPDTQILFYQNKCIGCGKCKEKCAHNLNTCDFCGQCAIYCPQDAREICGKSYTVDEVLQAVCKDISFYQTSGGGVTFSGGECMLQIDFLEEVLAACKQAGIHTAVDTAGHIPYEYFQRILPYVDLFLYDIKCFDSEKHKIYTGVSNQLILSNLKNLLRDGAKVWVRIPVVAGANDTEEEMMAIQEFLHNCGAPERVELIPYHAMGEHKYAALGRVATPFAPPSQEYLEKLNEIFISSYEFPVF